MFAIVTILLLAANGNCSGVCGSVETETACVGTNLSCNPCTLGICANPQRVSYPAVPPVRLIPDPDGCCYEEVVEFCVQRRTCIAPYYCGSCTMSGAWDLVTTTDHVLIPGEVCGSNCSF